MQADALTARMILLIAMALTVSDASAAQPTGAGDARVENPPDAELLEFIAGFEPVDGAWMDPMHFYDSFEAGRHEKENDHE